MRAEQRRQQENVEPSKEHLKHIQDWREHKDTIRQGTEGVLDPMSGLQLIDTLHRQASIEPEIRNGTITTKQGDENMVPTSYASKVQKPPTCSKNTGNSKGVPSSSVPVKKEKEDQNQALKEIPDNGRKDVKHATVVELVAEPVQVVNITARKSKKRVFAEKSVIKQNPATVSEVLPFSSQSSSLPTPEPEPEAASPPPRPPTPTPNTTSPPQSPSQLPPPPPRANTNPPSWLHVWCTVVPTMLLVFILMWSERTGVPCDNLDTFHNHFLDKSQSLVNTKSIGLDDLRNVNQWRHDSTDKSKTLRRTTSKGPAKPSLKIIHAAVNSDLISSQRSTPVSRLNIKQTVVHNVLSDTVESHCTNLSKSRPLIDLEVVALELLMDLKSVVMDLLMDPIYDRELRGNRHQDIEHFRFTEKVLHRDDNVETNRTATDRGDDLPKTTVTDNGLRTTNLVVIDGNVGKMKVTTPNYQYRLKTDFKLTWINSSASEEQLWNEHYEMVSTLSNIGSYTTDNSLLEGPDKGLLTTLSNDIRNYDTADRWRTIIPHLMEYLRLFVYIHTGHSVVRVEKSIRVVRVPTMGSRVYYLVLGVAAQSVVSAVSTVGVCNVSCWTSILHALLLLCGDVEVNPGPVITAENLIAAVRRTDFLEVKRMCTSVTDSSVLKIILETGTGDEEKTVLHIAAQTGNLRILKYLLNVCPGVDKQVVDKRGFNVLHDAARCGHVSCVMYLIEVCNIPINSRTDKGFTALYTASRNGHLDVIKYLISKGADKDCRDDIGNTPLIEAAASGHLDCVRYLCETAGVDIHARNIDNYTALHPAAHGGKLDCVRYLCETAGVDIHARSKKNRTALHIAAQKGNQDCVKYLLTQGADVLI